jgi:hypothetical protein
VSFGVAFIELGWKPYRETAAFEFIFIPVDFESTKVVRIECGDFNHQVSCSEKIELE